MTLFVLILLFNKITYCQTGRIIFSEVNYHCDSTRESGDWVELHNYDTVPANISNWIFTDSQIIHNFIIPSGTIIQPGKYLVICQDLNLFRIQHPDVTNAIGSFGFGLSGNSELLRLYDDQTHLYMSLTYADSLPWPKGADGYGRTLELKNPFVSLDNGENWFDGCMGGSPGIGYVDCPEKIIFSEINYNSDSLFSVGDWVEIRNIGLVPIDVSSWIFKAKGDSGIYIFPENSVLPPGSNKVLSSDLNKFELLFPEINQVMGPFNFGLKSKGDILRLFKPDGKIYFSIIYDNKKSWPKEADGNGYTLELLDSTGKMDEGSNWFAGCIGGSPGKHYDPSCKSLTIAEQDNYFNIFIYPNPVVSESYIEINTSSYFNLINISLSIFDISGRLVQSRNKFDLEKQEYSDRGQIKIPIYRNNLTPGIYIYKICNNNNVFTGKLTLMD